MTMAKDMPMQDSLEQVLLLKKREQNLYQYANFYRPQAPVLLDGKSRTERLSLKDALLPSDKDSFFAPQNTVKTKPLSLSYLPSKIG